GNPLHHRGTESRRQPTSRQPPCLCVSVVKEEHRLYFGVSRMTRVVWLVSAFLLVSLVLCAPAWARPAVSFSELPRTGCGPDNVEGWEFKTTAEITVSALGVYDFESDGLAFSIPVGLYDGSCQAVASATIPAGTSAALVGEYRYVAISPV